MLLDRPALPPLSLQNVDLNLLVVFDVLMREKNVTRAALALHRTTSAVSHSLARLRAQLGDPLLVRQGGRMVASPYAEALWADVGKVLQTVEWLLSTRADFDPATTTRLVRLACTDLTPDLSASVFNHFHARAPNLRLAILGVHERTLQELVDGHIDMVLTPAVGYEPAGLVRLDLATLPWKCGLRAGHPAAANWSVAAWASHPHVSVHPGEPLHSPVEAASREHNVQRVVSLLVPHLRALAEALPLTDLIATVPEVVLRSISSRLPIEILDDPLGMPPLKLALYIGERHSADAAHRWIAKGLDEVMGRLLR